MVGVLLVIFFLALIAGYIVLTIIETLLDGIWIDYAAGASGVALWALVLIVPTLAGVIVAFVRSRWEDGHNPLGGIAVNPITTRQYPSIIGAIATTLIGGLVLGPEVAMVSTGAWIGTIIERRTGIKEKAGMGIGALGGILALFVGPLLHGTFNTAPKYEFAVTNLIGAIGVGAATAGLLAIGRFLAIGTLKLHGGDRPKIHILALCGLVVGASALIYHLWTGNSVGLVMTSGESNVKELIALGTASAIGITILFKLFAYSISIGGGFRGGPFFPAIYVGAGMGAIAQIWNPSWGTGASAAGIAAACVYLSHTKWIWVVVIGVFIALIVGGWQLIPVAVLGSLVAKALPTVKVLTDPSGGEKLSEVR